MSTQGSAENDPPGRATVDDALAAWEAHGPTSLTVALMADALYGVRKTPTPSTWSHPVTGHVHTAGMQCRECRETPTPTTPDAGDAWERMTGGASEDECPLAGRPHNATECVYGDCPDASTSASEPLSEAEREALQAAVRAPQAVAPDMAYVYAAVERVVAAREAKARAEAGEQIAQAIEALSGNHVRIDRAARIAREVTR